MFYQLQEQTAVNRVALTCLHLTLVPQSFLLPPANSPTRFCVFLLLAFQEVVEWRFRHQHSQTRLQRQDRRAPRRVRNQEQGAFEID